MRLNVIFGCRQASKEYRKASINGEKALVLQLSRLISLTSSGKKHYNRTIE